GTLADPETAAPAEGDARLGARLIRTYARDWLDGSGRFAALFLPYLMEDRAAGMRKILKKGCSGDASEAPAGLTEIEEGELEGAVHPALDDAAGNGTESQAKQGRQKPGSGKTGK